MAHKPEVVSHNRKCRDLRTTGSLQEFGASFGANSKSEDILTMPQSGLSKFKCLSIHSLVGYWVDYLPEVVCPCLFFYNDD
jgi:hypothetical protein